MEFQRNLNLLQIKEVEIEGGDIIRVRICVQVLYESYLESCMSPTPTHS
jgi:hypothetical protein